MIVYISLPKNHWAYPGGLQGFTSDLLRSEGDNVLVNFPTGFGMGAEQRWVPRVWVAWTI